MVVEVLGARLLSPYFGDNVYVWSALISVTMVALAMGYWIGGRIADSRGRSALLDQVIAAAGVTVGVIPVLISALGGGFADWNYEAGLLASTLLCFGPSLFLLGIVSPLAVRLAARSLAEVGRSAGKVWAWSTAGGIVGALGAGFFLLPAIPVSRIYSLAGAVLLLLAIARRLGRGRWPVLVIMPALALAPVLADPGGWLSGPATWSEERFAVRHTEPSFHGSVRVIDRDDDRFLVIDGMCHSAMSRRTGQPMMPHVYALGALPYLRPEGRSLLLIGLGAGDVIRLLDGYGLQATAVEIAAPVARLASAFFGLREDSLRVVIDDGRRFVRGDRGSYDFIIMDAYAGARPAAHLLTREALASMRARLRPNGVVSLNLTALGYESALVRDLAATLESVFAHTLAVAVEPEPQGLCNVVFFASEHLVRLPLEWFPAPADPGFHEFLRELPARVIDPQAGEGAVITDDLNRVDAAAARAEIEMRRLNRQLLPASVLAP